MKLVFNIEKRHLIFFSLFLVLAGSVFVIANPQYPAKVGHQELQADSIYSWTENYPIKIVDPKGNWLGLGSNNGERNRFDFSVDSLDQILFYGTTAPDYKMDTFKVKADKITLIGSICSDEQGNNCILVANLIKNNKFIIFYGEEIITRTGEKIVGQLTQTDPGLTYVNGQRNIENTFDQNVGRRSAKTFCLSKGYNNVLEFTSTKCPTPNTKTVYHKQGDGESSYNVINSGCLSVYGILDYIKCI